MFAATVIGLLSEALIFQSSLSLLSGDSFASSTGMHISPRQCKPHKAFLTRHSRRGLTQLRCCGKIRAVHGLSLRTRRAPRGGGGAVRQHRLLAHWWLRRGAGVLAASNDRGLARLRAHRSSQEEWVNRLPLIFSFAINWRMSNAPGRWAVLCHIE